MPSKNSVTFVIFYVSLNVILLTTQTFAFPFLITLRPSSIRQFEDDGGDRSRSLNGGDKQHIPFNDEPINIRDNYDADIDEQVSNLIYYIFLLILGTVMKKQ